MARSKAIALATIAIGRLRQDELGVKWLRISRNKQGEPWCGRAGQTEIPFCARLWQQFGPSSKKDISNLENVLDRLVQLRPVSYRFKNNADTEPLTFRFIVQEIEPLFPEVVSDVNGFKGIS